MSRQTTIDLDTQLRDGSVMAPYVHDCLTARLAEVTGFRTFIVSASSVAMTFAMPDMGLLTADDMIKAASRIADFLPYPVITDFPGGFSTTAYGVHHNVERLLPSGTQAVIIDDTTPGQDGMVVAEELYLAKLAAAVAATESTGCQVIAATAAKSSLGLDEAVKRLQRAEAAGVGLVMARGLTTLSECRTLAASVTAPTMLDECTHHGGDDPIGIDDAFSLGFAIAAVRYVEKASLYGLMDFGRHTRADNTTVYHDDHDFDGRLPSLSYRSFYSDQWRLLEREIDADVRAVMSGKEARA